MIIPMFDQSREREQSSYGEAVRLSNELRNKPSRPIFDRNEIVIGMTDPVSGFDCETADYSDFTNWLNAINIKKSQAIFWFVIRIMTWRFPEKHTEIKMNLAQNRKLEFEMILSQMKKEVEWVGTVGYSGLVRLDGSLTNPKNRVVKLNNDKYKSIRK